MDYLVLTKGEAGPLASLQPSRDEAAEFWSALTGVEPVDTVLVLMRDRERAQEGDPHAHQARKVFVLETPEGYPTMIWGENAAELSELTFISHDEHRTAALDRQAETA